MTKQGRLRVFSRTLVVLSLVLPIGVVVLLIAITAMAFGVTWVLLDAISDDLIRICDRLLDWAKQRPA